MIHPFPSGCRLYHASAAGQAQAADAVAGFTLAFKLASSGESKDISCGFATLIDDLTFEASDLFCREE